MSEFKGKAGTIYIERSKLDSEYEIWFEDLCILGKGKSDIEALQDAADHVKDIGHLISGAIVKTLTTDS